jgi:hypothetical protein
VTPRPTRRHVTAGRDGRGVETTLCGLVADWEWDPSHKDLPRCATCEELDA